MLLTTKKSTLARTLANYLSLSLVIVAMAYTLYSSQTIVLDAALYWWGRVGWVMLGLLPLSAFYLYVVGQIVLPGQARTERVRRDLDIVIFAAPLLGMLGTVDGLRVALQQFYLIEGVENLMGVLGEFLNGASQMLYTTEWGLMIVIPAGLMKYIIFSEACNKKKKATEHTGTNVKSLVPVADSVR